MRKRKSLNIGITIGDPAGIGPEVSIKAVDDLNDKNIIPIIIGNFKLLQYRFPKIATKFHVIKNCPRVFSTVQGEKYIYDVKSEFPIPDPGKGDINTGAESLQYIQKALELWKNGSINAIVTGPVNKGLIEKSGTPFTGHTDYIADSIDEENPIMMMYSDKYRVIVATTHIPVHEICNKINKNILFDVIRTGYNSIKRIDGNEVKIAVAGLDPHCGDDGAIGNSDLEITIPAIEAAKKSGIPIEGPFAADTLFIPESWEEYNLVIAHYHDQGLIPFKMLAFNTGVNVTLGLTVTRTSVDHGTAYNIAGKGIANIKSMSKAIILAFKLESIKDNGGI